MAIQAVLTGDVVNSTRLGTSREKKLMKTIEQVFHKNKFEFYRGDSFQAFLHDASAALQTALLCRTFAISLSDEKNADQFDVRISIAAGKAKTPAKALSASRDEPFILSGRAFDEMIKKEKRLAMITSHALANIGLEVICDYINAIFSALTRKQAEVIFELLQGKTQQMVADKFKKSKSTIHQHVSAGRWPEIEALLNQYENIINQLSK